LALFGEAATRLWVVDRDIARLVAERAGLVAVLRAAGGDSRATAAAPALNMQFSAYPGGQVPPPQSSSLPLPTYPYQPGRPRGKWSRRRVQNLLLSLGVLLLTVAALIFIAVNWGTLGAGGRAAVLAGVTLSAAGVATVAAKRGLPSTAESVAALTLALLVVDGVGLRLAGVATGVAPATYAGVVAAAISVLTLGWVSQVPLRALRMAGLAAAELVLPLVLATSVNRPVGVAAVYGLQVVALLALRFQIATRASAVAGLIDTGLLRVTTYLWWAGALSAAIAATYGHSDLRSPAGRLELAALAAVALWTARHEAAELHLALATATGIGTVCGVVPHLDGSWRASAVEAAALLAACVVQLIPARVARASVAVVAAIGFGALMTAGKSLSQILVAPAGVSGHEVWKGAWSQIRNLRAADAIRTGSPWSGTPHLALLALCALVTAVVLVAKTRGAAREVAGLAVGALVVVTVLAVPFTAGWMLPVAVLWELVLGAALVLGAVTKSSANRVAGLVVMIVGAFLLVYAAAWSLRSSALTVMAVGTCLVVVTAAALVARGRAAERLVFVTVAAAFVALEAALVAAYQGASIAQIGVVLGVIAALVMMSTQVLRRRLDDVLATALQVVALVAAACAIGFSADEPPALALTTALLIVATLPGVVLGRSLLAAVWPALVQVLVCLEADTVHRWIAPGADLGSRALILAPTAGVVAVAAVACQRLFRPPAVIALTTGPTIYAAAALGVIVGRDLDQIWVVLLVGGVAAGLIAACGALAGAEDGAVSDPRLAIQLPVIVSSLLLLSSSWVRLAESHVHSVEPYIVPAAAILLAAGRIRRRADSEVTSWSAYGPGLILGLTPTLIQALADPGLIRPALVGVAALAVVAAGIRERLQAPLAVGGGVLALDAIAQLSPALAAVYDAVPRWTLIAVAGVLLLAVGATYERRIRDLRVLSRKFGALR
jgi:hypothetical protein